MTATVAPAATSLPRRVRVRRVRGEFVRWLPDIRDSRGFARLLGMSPAPFPGAGRDEREQMLPAVRRRLNDPDRSRRDRHISSSRRIRSSIGGCVLNSFSSGPMPSPWIREGWLSHRWAVALLAERIGIPDAAPILRSALARPGGYRVSSAP